MYLKDNVKFIFHKMDTLTMVTIRLFTSYSRNYDT